MRYTKMLAAALVTITLSVVVTAAPALAETAPNGPIHCCVD